MHVSATGPADPPLLTNIPRGDRSTLPTMTTIQDLPVEILRLIFRSFELSTRTCCLDFMAKLHPSLFVAMHVCKLWNDLALEYITDNYMYPWEQSTWPTNPLSRMKMLQRKFWDLQWELAAGYCEGWYYDNEGFYEGENCYDGRPDN